MTKQPMTVEEHIARMLGMFPCDCPSCLQEAEAEKKEEAPHSIRAEILDAAAACVLVDRQKTHGSPEESFTMISKLWGAFLGVHIEPHEVCAMMGLVKVARLKASPDNADNWVDMAGYAACGGELALRERPITNNG